MKTNKPQSRSSGTAGLILAGGQGRRMGGEDKGLLPVGDAVFAQFLAARIRPWVDHLAISANRNQSRYSNWADAVIGDGEFAGQGPLAGLLCGLAWARESGARHLLTCPCDTPALPERFFQLLAQQTPEQADQAVVARVSGFVQPLHAILPVDPAMAVLKQWLATGRRDAKGFVSGLSPQWFDCDDMKEDFVNVNRPEDLASLNRSGHGAL